MTEQPTEYVAAPSDAGERLDVVLARLAGSRAAAQRWIEEDRVRVDDRARAKRYAVRAGERIVVAPAVSVDVEPVEPATFSVAYEDEHLLVIDKPAGVVVHPGAGRPEGTLVQALAGRVAGGGDPVRPGVVHRLDRDTSGLLVFARGDSAHAALSDAIRHREVLREYTALVRGRPPARSGTIDAPLGRDRRRRTRMSPDTDDPHDAITHFSLEEALPESSLLTVRLETGRTHQIRAHLLAIGHPVLGDPEYGVAFAGLDRQFLHAGHLAFDHPVTGERVDVRSPLPADLERALATARGGA